MFSGLGSTTQMGQPPVIFSRHCACSGLDLGSRLMTGPKPLLGRDQVCMNLAYGSDFWSISGMGLHGLHCENRRLWGRYTGQTNNALSDPTGYELYTETTGDSFASAGQTLRNSETLVSTLTSSLLHRTCRRCPSAPRMQQTALHLWR